MEILALSALEIGALIAAGKADPREILRDALERAKKEDHDHAIFVHLTEQRALAEADSAAARAKSGTRRSALDGVPLAWKDNIDVAGTPCEAGSRLLKGRTPERDAPLVTRAARAGLVNIGKTNMTELAFSGIGYNPHTGTPRNASDDKTPRLPGGSSSGSAIAVARGLVPAAIGTDTGGSVRIPAAWNGLVGLKTTAARIGAEGLVLLSSSLDSVGPITRDVADAAALFEILFGEPRIDLGVANVQDLSLLVLKGPVLSNVESETLAAFEGGVSRIRSKGVAITEVTLASLEECSGTPSPAGAEAYALWGEKIEASPGTVFSLVEERFLAAKSITAAQYLSFTAKLGRLKRQFIGETAGFDAVLMPTIALRAPPIADVEVSADAYRSINGRSLSLPSLANRLGLCAITLPLSKKSGELPVGLTVLGRPFEERRLLQIGQAIETALAD